MKSSVKVDEKVMKQLNSNILKNGLIWTISTASIILTYITVAVFLNKNTNAFILSLMALVLAVGILLLWCYFKIKRDTLKENRTNEVEFFEDYLESRVIKNEQVVATQKVNYNEIIKIKETEDYIFIYPVINNAFVVEKKQFTSQELVEIKLLIYKNNPRKGK